MKFPTNSHINWAIIRFVLALFLLFGSISAFGDESYDSGDDPESSLSRYHDSGKIGGPNDRNEFSIDVWGYLIKKEDEDKKDDPDRMARAVNALRMLEKKAEKMWGTPINNSPEERIKSTIESVLKAVDEQGTLNLGSNIINNPTHWEIDSDDLVWAPIAGKEVRFKEDFSLKEKCNMPASEKCLNAFKDAIQALRMADLTYRCIEYSSRVNIAAAHDFFKMRTKQRSLYRTNTIPQWPWEELFVNAPIYAYLKKDEKGSPEPPTFQLIVVHPDIAMEYVPKAEDGQQFKATFMMELLGANFWNWEKDGSMDGPFFGYPLGFGVVASYADREKMEDWGIGGIVHINNVVNFGVTFREGYAGYFISANLIRLFGI